MSWSLNSSDTSAEGKTSSCSPTSNARLSTLQRDFGTDVKESSTSKMRFSAEDWRHRFHVVVLDKEPPLPHNIERILNERCPFWENHQVKDTHQIVLIPATIIPWNPESGKAVRKKRLTLNNLWKLIQEKQELTESLHTSDKKVKKEVRDVFVNSPLPKAPYWLLMTNSVVPDSPNRNYGDGYRLPYALEAATGIKICPSKFLRYNGGKWMYTGCIPIKRQGKTYYPVVGISNSGKLDIGLETSDAQKNYSIGTLRVKKLPLT